MHIAIRVRLARRRAVNSDRMLLAVVARPSDIMLGIVLLTWPVNRNVVFYSLTTHSHRFCYNPPLFFFQLIRVSVLAIINVGRLSDYLFLLLDLPYLVYWIL